jgi:hypothetical protein
MLIAENIKKYSKDLSVNISMSYLINDNEYEKILSYYKDNLKSEEEY